MNSTVNISSLLELMGDCSDFSDQSTVISALLDKCKNSEKTLNQIDNELCQPYTLIKEHINPNMTVQDLEQVCKPYESKSLVIPFLKNLRNCTKSSTTTELDPEKVNTSLTSYFDDAFWKSFGLKKLLNSLHSLFQSYLAWNLINNFHIPAHDNEIKRIKSKIEKCAIKCNSLLNLTTFNAREIENLENVQEILNEIKEKIESITDDLKNRIAEAQKHRSNNYVSALMNGLSTLLDFIFWEKVIETTDEHSRSSLTCGASTLIRAGCTLAHLINTGKATDLINRLQEILNIMEDLEKEQQKLSEKVSAKLSTIHVHI